ncbi:hypothetical protein [Cupriavidus sp. RAF12]|uniref:hypothetical protein n=1 Tax=Cupriavidus sp. RAF12 TaxID=3233050 RepID=UPI003F8E5184
MDIARWLSLRNWCVRLAGSPHRFHWHPGILYRQRSATGAGDEPPIVVVTASGPLVVYGTGGELSAIPDQQSASGAPRQIDAPPAGEGVVLRGPARRASADDTGWTLDLPHPGEQVAELQMANPVHLAFTTRTPDGRARS